MKKTGNDEKNHREQPSFRSRGKLLFSARGPFSHSRIWELADQIVGMLQTRGTPPSLSSRVRKAWLEMSQNIIRHGRKGTTGQKGSGTSMELWEEGGRLLLRTTNLLGTKEAQALGRLAALLNSLDNRSLEELYDRQLQSAYENRPEPLSLGLIRIRRFSRSPLHIRTRRINVRTAQVTIGVRFS